MPYSYIPFSGSYDDFLLGSKKITQLPAVVSLSNTDFFSVINEGETRKATIAQLTGVIPENPLIRTSYNLLCSLSSNWESSFYTLKDLSGNWQNTFNTTQLLSSNWQNTFNTTQLLSSNWQSTYQTVCSLSVTWGYQGTDLKNLSSVWQSTYQTVCALSANWNSAYNNLNALTALKTLSSNWQSTYKTVCALSANWDSVYNTVNSLSDDWNAAYNDVTFGFLAWQSTYQTVCALSANWDSAYSGLTSLQALSGNWQSTYQTVCALSANWEKAFAQGTHYQANSASFALKTYLSQYLPLSGGTIDGDLILNGNFFVTGTSTNIHVDNLTISDSLIHLASGNPTDILDIGFVGSYTETPNGYQHTGLVRNASDNIWTLFSGLSTNPISSTEINFSDPSLKIDTLRTNLDGGVLVFGNLSASGNISAANLNIERWNDTSTIVRNNSANWISTYNTVSSLSSNWQNVYTTVQTNSSNWQNFNSLLSSYLPLSGGSLTGRLTAGFNATQAGLNIGLNVSPSSPLGGDVWITSLNRFAWQGSSGNVFAAATNLANTFNNIQTFGASTPSTIVTVNNTGTGGAAVFTGNSSSAVVRVTQLGSGDALRIEDETNPDSTPFIIDNLGNVGIGLSSIPDTNSKLTVAGNISSTGIIYASGGDSNKWNETYTTVLNNSAEWNSGGSALRSLSGNWQSTYATVCALSANWNSAYRGLTALQALSGNWQSTYATVCALSAEWNSGGSALRSLSGNWQSTYATVCALSAEWNSGGSALRSLSGNWQSTYATVCALSANWNSAYRGLTALQALSGNWQSTYATVCALSANWNSGGNLANYLPLSGGTITGALAISGTTNLSGNLIVKSGQNVGIGTNNPNQALTVMGSICATQFVYKTNPIFITTSSPYTLTDAVRNSLILINNSLSSVVIVPPDTSTFFTSGGEVNITGIGTGIVYVSGGSGVTIRSPENRNRLRTQNSTATLVKLSANDWLLFGDIWL